MNVDEIALKFIAKVSEFKSSMSTTIGLTKKLDDSTNKVAQTFDKIASSTSNADNSFKESKARIQELENQLKSLKNTYNAHSKAFGERLSGMSSTLYNPTMTKFGTVEDMKATEYINQETLDAEKEKIQEVEEELNNLKETIQATGQTSDNTNFTPKMEDAKQDLEDAGNSAKKTASNMSNLGNRMMRLGSIAKSLGAKGFDSLKNKFKDLSKNLTKGVDGNIKQLKKLALGLIGVRTVMSVLTKAVNAYLSFDSELQDSLNNSWNLLGSLLAPAIELVARMFAIATNYVAQFVNALTGIDLVARANAKALETQAKANAKANNAQRGLLGMDEITNLPSESAISPASQIQMDNTIKSFKVMDDLLTHLRNGEWHLAGEDIAHGINDLLSSINWKKIQKNAYQTSYNFADFLNGLFEVDWSQIGTTIAESVNTWTELVKGFADKFSFIQLGKGLGNSLTHMITDIDWVELAETVNKLVGGIFDGISTFLETTNWGDIGKSFGDFVRTIDWGKLLFDAIKISILAFQGFTEFLASFIVSLLDDLSAPAKQKFIEIGDTLYDFVDTRIHEIIGFLTSMVDYFISPFKDFVDGVKLLLKGDLLGAFKKIGKAIINAFVAPLNIFINGLNLVLYPLREIIVLLAKATGKNLSIKDIKIPNVPSLAVGTPNIETEGLYHLHEGEMVVPKRYNPNTNGYDNGADNKQIIDLLISLNASMLEYADRPININMNSKKVAEAIYDDSQQISKNRNQSNAVVRS